MNKRVFAVTIIIMFLFVNSTAQNQNVINENSIDLTNRHSLSLNLGMINQSSVSVNVSNVSAKLNFIGSILYNYWASDEFAFEFSLGMLSGEVKQGVSLLGVDQEVAAVFPLQFGLKYYPAQMVIGKNIRPFGGLNFIIANGYNVSNKVLLGVKVGTETVSQTAFGARIGFGADAFINNWLKVGLNTGYILLTDFPEEIGSRKNYSGLDISFGFGFLF
ncbi:MAG: hypothetical protein FJ214_05310 [Ignavibacteria bacterium]|nr:hypothetical protein [Ignavibacteria bacterium]